MFVRVHCMVRSAVPVLRGDGIGSASPTRQKSLRVFVIIVLLWQFLYKRISVKIVGDFVKLKADMRLCTFGTIL